MSDLAIEFGRENRRFKDREYFEYGCKIIYTDVSDRLEAEILNKKIGKYYSIIREGGDPSRAVAFCLKKLISSLNADRSGKIMLVGLGNPRFVADALGNSVLDRLDPDTRLTKVYPSVSAVTGVESTDIVRAMAELIRPELIVVIDTLCTDNPNRINNVFQLSTAGISPGGGVGGKCESIDSDNLGAKIIALGVPLVSKLAFDGNTRVYAPVEIDALVEESADIISSAIAEVFG